jgi:hypothetical protein
MASWIETVWEYKAVKKANSKEEAEKIKNTFNDLYKRLQKCGKE